jgi:nucleotide-binding universal stress UspA family protein
VVEDKPFIVVGVDGSPPSRRALAWAARQAQLTGAQLRVVTAWQLPRDYGFPVVLEDVDLAAEARGLAEATVQEVLGPHPDIPVVTEVHQGHPAVVLVDAARGADLLVVGSRGHGAFTGMLLGSVSEYCVTHADCPVVVFRRGEQPGEEQPRD